jgi:hypothetical protein
MNNNPFEHARIHQLLSSYGPEEPPRLDLDFGDYLSILWRLDGCPEQPHRARYYQRCLHALSEALDIQGRALCRLVDQTEPGNVYRQIPNTPYRSTTHLIDARDRKAAIAQLIALRSDLMRIGTFQEAWSGSWPGSGILDAELRERVFAVLFTALQGQFGNFGRMLLVIDIVLANLLLGLDSLREVGLDELVTTHQYPNPNDARWRQEYMGDVQQGHD